MHRRRVLDWICAGLLARARGCQRNAAYCAGGASGRDRAGVVLGAVLLHLPTRISCIPDILDLPIFLYNGNHVLDMVLELAGIEALQLGGSSKTHWVPPLDINFLNADVYLATSISKSALLEVPHVLYP